MLIETEQTPNPATLKFLPGRPVAPDEPHDFPDADAGQGSPLAARIFALGDVERVFFGADFITVTLAPGGADWAYMKPQVLTAIMGHLMTGAPFLAQDAVSEVETFDDPLDAEIVAQIRELLDTRVRPAVANDGGDIVYRGFQEGVVYLHMRGSCAGCPSSTATLKGGIENLLRHYVPEVREVRAV